MHTALIPVNALIPGIACVLVLGCSGVKVRDPTYAQRCADAMQLAAPNAAVEITSETAEADQAKDLNTFVANVQGVGKGHPDGQVGMQCTFHNNVLVSIRWTAGPER